MLDKSLSSSGLGPVNRIKARRIRLRRAFHFQYHSKLSHVGPVLTVSPAMDDLSATERRYKLLKRFHFNGARPVPCLHLAEHHVTVRDSDNVPRAQARR